MKLLCSIFVCCAALAGSLQAATVTIAKGFGTGILVTSNSVATSYTMEVGGFEGGTFTSFASLNKLGTEGLGGGFVGTGPISLNNDAVFIRVTVGSNFAVLSTSGFFPADVASALLSTSIALQTSTQTSIVSLSSPGVASFGSTTNLNFAPIPEPSTALLGLLGVAGLIRRRR